MSPTRRILIGIDVGGTNTDGVAVDRLTGQVLKKLKVPTRSDLVQCVGEALKTLLHGVDNEEVERISLSTTLVTNAVVTNRLEPVGMILFSGPGLDASLMSGDPNCRVVPGMMDHRGREIAPPDPGHLTALLDSFHIKGISVVAVAGKFSVRNPSHELLVNEMAQRDFDHVAMSHTLSGALNFPRRAATAYLCAGVWRRHTHFIAAAKRTVAEQKCTAPVFLLRADGGAQKADSFSNAAEAALSGPAASIMGIAATSDLSVETIGLDVGGTTTDISFYVKGAPLIEPHGATIGDYLTQIRSLFTRSLPVGGDSALALEEGCLRIGPERKGPAAALGGPCPTPTDAMIALGLVDGDGEAAKRSLLPLAGELGLTVEETAKSILAELAERIIAETFSFLSVVNSRPVYTIHELLEDHKVKPERIVLVGGPAKALAPFIGEASGLPVLLPRHHDVANAIGAAVASVSLEVNATCDTAHGWLAIPEASVHKGVDKGFTMAQVEKEARDGLTGIAENMGFSGETLDFDIAERESFNIIEGHYFAGAVHRLKLQVRPAILTRVGG